jgi:hypothetical protein
VQAAGPAKVQAADQVQAAALAVGKPEMSLPQITG